MSKTKKQAGQALKDLANYLRRDAGATQKIEVVQRYVGELRQTHTEFKDRIAALERQLSAAHGYSTQVVQDADKRQADLREETAAHQRTRVQLAAANKRVESLEKELEPDDVLTTGDDSVKGLANTVQFNATMKVLQRRMKKAPMPVHASKARVMWCRLESVVPEWKAHHMSTLGMFVTCCAVLGFPVAFTSHTRLRAYKTKENFKPLARTVHWLRDWIRVTDEQSARYDAELANEKRVQLKGQGSR